MNVETIAKVAKWLETLTSHGIYDHVQLAVDFTNATSEPACWAVHTPQQTRAAIRKRGLGGSLDPEVASCAYGWEIANALAKKYTVGFAVTMHGRGSQFHNALFALRKAGHIPVL